MGNCIKPLDPIFEVAPKYEDIDMTPLRNGRLIIIIIYGGPGSGRATQCSLISEKYQLVKLSCGELLRHEILTGNDRGIMIAKIMKQGYLVPSEILLSLIQERMLATYEHAKGFVIDGYPREKAQAVQFDAKVFSPKMVFYLVVNSTILRDRCQGRAIIDGRHGDTIEVIERRIKYFINNYKGVINHYKDKLFSIDGSQNVNKVFSDICAIVNESLNDGSVSLQSLQSS